MILLTLDKLLSFVLLLMLSPLLLVIFLLIMKSGGSPLFFQSRVGRNQRLFKLIKFRSMELNTEEMPTHLIDRQSVTSLGAHLRRTKLDELPQLWNVLIGDMSLVGPRPCLPSQKTLIQERFKRGVFNVRPGITGLAQIKGIDMSKPQELAEKDLELIKCLDVKLYFLCLLLTATGKGKGDRLRTF